MSKLHSLGQGIYRPQSKLDVIFVHGLTGHPFSSWQHNTNAQNDCWPYWLSDDLDTAAIHMLEYEARWSDWFGDGEGSITVQAREILNLLSSKDIGRRPIVFVCHSLGGILVKQIIKTALELSNPNWGDISSNTKAAIFISTPHRGNDLAKILHRFHLIFQTSKHIEFLKSEAVLDLSDWYRHNTITREIKTLSYYETDRTVYKRNLFLRKIGVQVVDRDSADPGIPGVIPSQLPGDHIAVCKPSNRDHRLYKEICQLVSDIPTSNLDEAKPPPYKTDDDVAGAHHTTSAGSHTASDIRSDMMTVYRHHISLDVSIEMLFHTLGLNIVDRDEYPDRLFDCAKAIASLEVAEAIKEEMEKHGKGKKK